MARFWKEKLDSTRHRGYICSYTLGGDALPELSDNIIERCVYFVEVCSFTFQFASLAQIEECLAVFSQKIHPSSMEPGITLEHYWQCWEQRLPYWLFEEPKRLRVAKSLRRSLAKFSD
jgi:hypothetical protein